MPVNPASRSTSIQGVQRFLDRDFVTKGGYIDYYNMREEDDFPGDLLDASWAVAVDGAGTGIIPAAHGAQLVNGAVLLSTAATNDNKVELAHGRNYQAQLSVIFETALHLDDITTVAVMAGLTDDSAEAANSTAYATAAGRVLTADDCVLIGFDTDDVTYTNWTALAGIATVAATPVDLTATPANGTYAILRIEIDTSGNADFFVGVDGTGEFTYRGSIASAVTTTVNLCPYVAVLTRDTAVRVATVDYVRVYQPRTS